MYKSKKLIAVFIPVIDQYYQTDVWQAILDQSTHLDYNVLFFCGSVLNIPLRDDKQSNILYQLPNMGKIDGIISSSGTLANYISHDYFREFIQPFESVPIVHLSHKMDNANTINIDNYNGMKKLVDHTITEHEYDYYLFISGPATNFESNHRLQAFLDSMEEHQVADTNYITLTGDFSKESSEILLRNMYAEHNFSPDIIICANDEMAIGALNILQELNIETPGEVAFTGFDNIPNATTFSPSFTTIHQPLYEMGKAAVTSIHELLNQTVDVIDLSFVGDLILRESCGCSRLNSTLYPNIYNNVTIDDQVLSDLIRGFKNQPLKDYLALNHLYLSYDFLPILQHLLDVLSAELVEKLPTGSFTKLFYSYNTNISLHFQYFNWTDFIQWFKETLYDLGHAPLSPKLHNIIYNTSMYANELSLRKFRKENYDFMEMYYYSSELIMELTRASSIDHMFQIIVPYIKAYDFSDYYICLFNEPIVAPDINRFTYPKVMQMAFGYENNQVIQPYSFDTLDMLPSHLIHSTTSLSYIFHPIFFGSTHYGYHICKPDIAVKSIYRTIKEQIVNTLDRLKTQKILEEYNKQLKDISNHDPLTKSLNRRGIYYEFEKLRLTHDVHKIAIIYGDIDNLKPINDLYGHFEGDFAIKSIAKILKQSISTDDFVGRFGGDEFLCIIKNPDESTYKKTFMTRLNKLLSLHNTKEDKAYTLDISFGFSILDMKDNIDIDAIFEESDTNLYKVKQLKKIKRK